MFRKPLRRQFSSIKGNNPPSNSSNYTAIWIIMVVAVLIVSVIVWYYGKGHETQQPSKEQQNRQDKNISQSQIDSSKNVDQAILNALKIPDIIKHSKDIRQVPFNELTPVEQLQAMTLASQKCYGKNANLDDCLHTAAEKGDIKLIDKFLADGADINAISNCGAGESWWLGGPKTTPLTFAALHSPIESRFAVMEHLINKGADVNKALWRVCHYFLTNWSSGNFRQDVAKELHPISVMKYLLQKGANSNADADSDGTPIIIWMLNNDAPKEMIKLFIEYGANLHKRDKNGQSAIDIIIGKYKPSDFPELDY